ncbi:MAG: murein L,D-transpeptidase catalytic domain family protein [Lysobacter sp.]|nr:murein L,D-transpeptidase catalytic domain family protein [Lysobacter sp.]
MSPRSVAVSLLLALGAGPLASANDAGMPVPERVPAAVPDLLQRLHAQAPTLDSKVLGLALDAAGCAAASGQVASPRRLAVIDYSKPSTEPRLWVFDLPEARLLHAEHVAHGRRSGENFATAFSNQDSSHQTSLGLFATAETYVGGNGYSLRMDGLEPGINDRARDRAIVMHGAPYVDPVMAQRQGRLGRSLGCPAVRPAVAHEVIDTLKGGQLLFAYYPDRQWLANSRFFRCRAGLAAQGGASRPAGGR